jgi:tryptophan-rich hypothetical protein
MDLSHPHPVNPKKLLRSKWTAARPQRREKHFMVTEVKHDDIGLPTTCVLEAVHSGRETELDWRDLKDPSRWLIGWR